MIFRQLIIPALAGLFSLQAHAADPVWDANTVNLAIEKIDNGVYTVYDDRAHDFAPKGLPLATSAGVIVGDKGVMLVETMINKRLHQQLMALVKTVTDKPILYAVNTSFHGDHSYGNYLLDDSVTLIQHKNTQAYIQQHFAKDVNFMINTFGKNRGMEQVTPTTADILIEEQGALTIDLGNKEVQIKDFGFAQTGGDLFVYLPKEHVVWTGNAIVAQKPGLPWLLDGHLSDTLTTLTSLYQALPQDTKVIPGHSHVVDKSAIKWNIDYLAEIKQQVTQAVNKGLNQEQVVQKVKMDNYRGYALFDWVHPALNVPAAYQELNTH
ncbi:MBL fold metallo-hydrolase [Thalassomonas actiniarum]|uniref:MBL fold metallo-hydrolase n=2 Tax=Thalassomonas actiniarum TaxID=485447 RepID=A0AAE9YVD5_9GAMM|nr:MBL fold metallo-hydrolase [Thalassomonas actiniarum]